GALSTTRSYAAPSATTPTAAALLDYTAPLPSPAVLAKGSANRHANLSPARCRQQLKPYAASFQRQQRGAPGIATTLRVVEKVGDVTFVVPPKKSPFGQLDCRLALALVDFAAVVAPYGIREVRI